MEKFFILQYILGLPLLSRAILILFRAQLRCFLSFLSGIWGIFADCFSFYYFPEFSETEQPKEVVAVVSTKKGKYNLGKPRVFKLI